MPCSKVLLAAALLAALVSCAETAGRCRTCLQQRDALLDALTGNQTALQRKKNKLVKAKAKFEKLEIGYKEVDRKFNAAKKGNAYLTSALIRFQEAFRLLLQEYEKELTLSNQRSEHQEHLIKDAEVKLYKAQQRAHQINSGMSKVVGEQRKKMAAIQDELKKTHDEKDQMEIYYVDTLKSCEQEQTTLQQALVMASQEKTAMLRGTKELQHDFSQLVTEKDAMEDFYVDNVQGLFMSTRQSTTLTSLTRLTYIRQFITVIKTLHKHWTR